MQSTYGFELLQKQTIKEFKTEAELFRHTKSGAELLSLSNDDTNKVFGITFRTPPADSTGIAHIIEHSVLCGSRKYPVKEPFVELLKGSVQTFLNALTFPDKTCYPVASQNLRDFYNLIDVYLDAVFYPRLTHHIFEQEGWHYELENLPNPLSYKGVVFNEMKGVYSSADSLLAQYSQQSLFPDITYGLDSGGDPKKIPNLTYEQFSEFHRRYYHPSNSRIYFYGDDDPKQRLKFTEQYLRDFEHIEVDSSISLQNRSSQSRRITKSFPAGDNERAPQKGMVTINFLLEKTTDVKAVMAFGMLEHILLGMPASPLRKALIDSGLGDGIAGVGFDSDLQQMYFSTGLKGIDIKKAGKVESLIFETLSTLCTKGIDPGAVAAAINTIEFRLRENNSGGFPRGLLIMLRVLTAWLYGADPFSMLTFEVPLNQLKSDVSANQQVFERLIDQYFLKNLHRTTVILKPDSEMAEAEEKAEKAGLAEVQSSMTAEQLQAVMNNTRALKQIQQAPDSPEALATIPRLKLSDLDKKNRPLPLESSERAGASLLYHDIFTNGVFYCDIGLNLHLLPPEYLSCVPLFGRALLETGTQKDDFIALSQRIGQKTGGIKSSQFTSAVNDSQHGTAWLFLRGKAMLKNIPDLLDILADVLLSARLDDQKRIKQIVLEEKALQEQKLIPQGHLVIGCRLRAHFNEADWADEQMSGISYLLFLRELEKKIDTDWKRIHTILEEMRQLLVRRLSMVVNVTVDGDSWQHHEPQVLEFIEGLPDKRGNVVPWPHEPPPACEGMIVPSLVNYVGKGANLYELGYQYNGSVHVISNFLRTTWLWEKIRVQGGAYGASCRFDRLSGGLVFVSYRDPNLVSTLELFDQTAQFLDDVHVDSNEIEKSIIGAIGDIDAYMLPDSQGYVSMQRYLNGNTEVLRQQMRDGVLATTPDDVRAFGSVLHKIKEHGVVKVLGSEQAIQDAHKTIRTAMDTFTVL